MSFHNQDAVLFSGSVRDNLFLGFPDIESSHLSVDDGLNLFPLLEKQEAFTFGHGIQGGNAWNMEERMSRVR